MDFGTDPLFGLSAFIVAYIVGRIISERALKRLSAEEKARLLDAFSGYRIYSLAATLCVPVLYFAVIRFYPQLRPALTPLFSILFVMMLFVISALTFRKLKGLNLPGGYIRSFLVSSGVQYIGIGFLFASAVAKYAW